MKNFCKNCGKEYEYIFKRGTYKTRYCSIECRNEFNKKDNEPQKRICLYCGKEYDWDPSMDKYGKVGNFVDSKKFCCYECGTKYKYEKVRETTLNRWHAIGWGSKDILSKCQETAKAKYGTSNNYDKIKQTALQKYGVENVSKVFNHKISASLLNTFKERGEEIVQKRKETNFQKYGVEVPVQNEIIKEKIKQTCLDRYGVENANQSEEIKEKVRQINLKKYGTEYASQNEVIRNKIKQSNKNKSKEEKQKIKEKFEATNLQRYGVKQLLSSKEIKDKIRKTNLLKYGKETAFNYEKIKQTNLEKYGVEYTCLLPECQNNNKYLISKINLNFQSFLKENNINSELEFKLSHYSFDLKTDNNILIEINPTFTHNSTKDFHKGNKRIVKRDPYYHYNKQLFAKQHGYHCIQIWDWDDKQKILNLLKETKQTSLKEYTIKILSFTDVKSFLNENSLYDIHTENNIFVCLYADNLLVGILVFNKSTQYDYELLDVCFKSEYKAFDNIKILFEYFIKQYNPSSIIAYCDNAKFMGEVYTKLGMVLKDYGKPNRHLYNIKTKDHIIEDSSSNDKLLNEGYLEIYDCGLSLYIWNKK